MPTSDERLRILKMVQDGKISAEEGVSLIDALEESERLNKEKISSEDKFQSSRSVGSRWLRICITEQGSGKVRANIRLPLNVVKAGAKLGARFSPEVEGLDMQTIMDYIRSGATGRIYSVMDQNDDEVLEVFIE